MSDLAAAMEAGDYAAAYAAFIQQPDAGTQGGLANAALLLGMCERFADAEQLLARTQAKAVEWIVRGDRARVARWRDPQAAARLAVSAPTAALPHYSQIAIALVTGDASRVTPSPEPPRPGTLTLRTGQTRPFSDLRDCDDAIGRMFEVFIDDTVVYFPFEHVRSLEITPSESFVTLYSPRCTITDRAGNVAHGFLPTLYAGSTTAPAPTLRTGRETRFSYVGSACRGIGQRDLKIDGGTMMGIERVAAIAF